VDAAPVVHKAQPRERHELLRERDRGVERAAGRHDAVHEPDALGLVRVDLPAGEDQVEGTAETDDAGQPVRAAVDEGHAEAALEAPEAGSLACDPQIAPCRELEAPGDAP